MPAGAGAPNFREVAPLAIFPLLRAVYLQARPREFTVAGKEYSYISTDRFNFVGFFNGPLQP